MSDNEEQNLKVLKKAVISMGVLLIVGTIALVVAVVIRSANSKNEVYSNVAAKEITNCMKKNTSITVDSKIISATTNNNILTLVTSDSDAFRIGGGKQKVALYDLCSGEILGKIEVVSK